LCFNTGYKGRIGIFELFVLEEKLQPLILKNPTEEEIYLEIKDNFVSMKQDGLIKALRKVTTLEEVERVTGIL
jgi:type II secretory ATPase GspE/PulE/Tfp pilus assembly ATPase PilB-like protein